MVFGVLFSIFKLEIIDKNTTRIWLFKASKKQSVGDRQIIVKRIIKRDSVPERGRRPPICVPSTGVFWGGPFMVTGVKVE